MTKTSQWGERSIRTFVVGVPAVILMQKLTGGSRPNDEAGSSHWDAWGDNHGVSGHSFMSAIPFINAAKLTDNRMLKGALYGGSLLGALSRVNDNAHYPSQVALGWWLAYVASSAIDRTDSGKGNFQITPYFMGNGYGAMLEYRF